MIALLISLPSTAFTAGQGLPADLDTGFSGDGKIYLDLNSSSQEHIHGLVIQSDGKIVVVGSQANPTSMEDTVVVRFNADGTEDFRDVRDIDGSLQIEILYDVALQSDGKIVGFGTRGTADLNFLAIRFNSSGTLDTTFGTSGYVTMDMGTGNEPDFAWAGKIQSDGKIILAGDGNNQICAVRYNSDGSVDTSFATGGVLKTTFSGQGDSCRDLIVQPDGKIILAGYCDGPDSRDFAIIRLNSDGSPDSSFNGGSPVIRDIVGSLSDDTCLGAALQSDGKILLAGRADVSNSDGYTEFVVSRFNSDGSVDTSFGAGGTAVAEFSLNLVTNDSANAIAVQSDGKIVLAGEAADESSKRFGVARFNSDGTLDTGFDMNGMVETAFSDATAYDVAIQSDGKIVVAGDVDVNMGDVGLARYLGGDPPPPSWFQLNTDGFGSSGNTEVTSMGMFSTLFVGTENMAGTQVWNYSGSTWVQSNTNGFGDSGNTRTPSMTPFNSELYAGTYNAAGAQLWKLGETWSLDHSFVLTDPTNKAISSMITHTAFCYFGTENTTSGTEVWQNTGMGWSQINANGFGDQFNTRSSSMAVYSGQVYVGTKNIHTGGQIWSYGGSTWSQSVSDGFGDSGNIEIASMAEFNGELYAGAYNTSGAQIHKYNGTSWSSVITNGFGDSNNTYPAALEVHNGKLYAGVGNTTTGAEVWESPDGSTWAQVNTDGFGDVNNIHVTRILSGSGHLHAGTYNDHTGAEVWEYGIASPQYTLTVTVTGSGTVSGPGISCPGDCTENYNQGTNVQLSAAPYAGYEFTGWVGSATGTTTPITITMNENKTVGAGFAPPAQPPVGYKLTTQVIGGNGKIVPDEGTYTWAENTIVPLSAVPDPHYGIKQWNGTDNDASKETDDAGKYVNKVTMNSDKTVSVEFEKKNYQLTVNVNGNGKVTPAGGTYDAMKTVELTAEPDPGNRLVLWKGTDNDLSTEDKNQVTLIKDTTVTVSFEPGMYNLTVNTVGNGKVTPSSGTYNFNDQVSLVAEPEIGYRVKSWSGTDNDLSTAETNTVTMTGDKTVVVVFEMIPKTTVQLTTEVIGEHGSLSPESGTYESYTVVGLTAQPEEGYRVKAWQGTANDLLKTNENTVILSTSKTVTVEFEKIPPQYTLTYLVSEGRGNIVPASGQSYEQGTKVVLTAVPEADYRIKGWSGTDDDTIKQGVNVVTMNADKTVTVAFERDVPVGTRFKLTVTVISGQGQVVPSGGEYEPGTRVTLTATPDEGWVFGGWGGAFESTDNPVELIIDYDITVTADFRETPQKPSPGSGSGNEATFPTGNVTISVNPGGPGHNTTFWCHKVQGAPDFICEQVSGTRRADPGLTDYTFSDLQSGLKYIWKVGFGYSWSSETFWSDEYRFKVGVSTRDDSVRIPPGVFAADYRMVSIVQWPDNPSCSAVFADEMGGTYNREDFRVGTYDPNVGNYGGYVECSDTLMIEPGKAYWFLARNGVNLSINGVPVSNTLDIDVPLDYNAGARNGWNMIAPPNNADYRWADVQVLAYNSEGTMILNPTPIKQLAENNNYLDRRMWTFENGAYMPYLPDETGAYLVRYTGAWVKAETSGVFLRFPAAAQTQAAGVITLINRKHENRWSMGQWLAPETAVAASDDQDSPPEPMYDLTVNLENGSARIDSGGGCFISETLEK